ncbi:MAG: S-layer homology domain-containing protein [Clostridia bacterium]|jgi:hypothetical protein
MKRAVLLLLIICLLLTPVYAGADNDDIQKILGIYSLQESLSVWEALGMALNDKEIPSSFFDGLSSEIISKEGVYRSVIEYAKTAIILKAANKDPHSFEGYDIIQKIADFEKIESSGLNGPIYSLLALYETEEKTGALWTRDKLRDLILTYQNTDGGFALVKGWASDNDLTCMALTALSEYPADSDVKSATTNALAFLSSKIGADGLMYYQNNDSSENLSWTIIALCALDIPLSDPAFLRDGKTVYDTLISTYRLEDGTFRHSISGTSNNIATEQALLAMSAMNIGNIFLKDNTDEPAGTPDIVIPDTSVTLPFTDKNDISDWALSFISKGYETGMIKGDDGGLLRPKSDISRAEMAALLVRALGLPLYTGNISRFSDVAGDDWFGQYVTTAYIYGIMAGTDMRVFSPYSTVAAGEFKELLMEQFSYDTGTVESLYLSGHVTREEAAAYIMMALEAGETE